MGDPDEMVQVACEFTPSQAWALAQLAKRVTWSELQANAVDDDEASAMHLALRHLEDRLAEQGVKPR